MKKILSISIIASLLFASCIKDEPFEIPAEPDPEPEVKSLVVNEFITTNDAEPFYYVDPAGNGCDWAEFYNFGTEAIDMEGMFLSDKGQDGSGGDIYEIPGGNNVVTTVPAGGYLVIIFGAADANGADMEGIIDGKIFIPTGLSSTKDLALALFDTDKSVIDVSAEFAGLEAEHSMGRESDGGTNWISFAVPTPGAANSDVSTPANVMVNELMTKVITEEYSFYTDAQGDYADWVELVNTGDQDLNLAGYYFSDKGEEATTDDMYLVPDSDAAATTVPGKGRLMVVFGAADDVGNDMEGIIDGILFIPTGLKSSGDVAVAIFEADQSTLLTVSEKFNADGPFGELEDDKSLGRENDGSDTWVIFDVPTPNEANSDISTPANVMVNELMTKVITEEYSFYTDAQGDYADWVELVNTGDQDLNLAGYYFSDKGEEATTDDMYLVPDSDAAATTVPGKGRLMVVFGAADEVGNDMEGIIDGILFIPTGLKSSGDVAVAIFEADQSTLLTVSEKFNADGPFGDLEDDKSLGREIDGSDTWVIFDVPTPDATNQ